MLTEIPTPEYIWFQQGIDSYQQTFADLGISIVRNLTFRRLHKAISSNRAVNALDVMADPTFIRQLQQNGLTGGVAIGLNPGTVFADEKNLGMIMGNILTDSPWQDTKKWLEEHGQASFDFVYSRPVGAVDEVYQTIDDLNFTFQHMYQLTDPHGGRLISQLPRWVLSDLPRWQRECQARNISVKYKDQNPNDITIKRHPILIVTRERSSSVEIPTLQGSR